MRFDNPALSFSRVDANLGHLTEKRRPAMLIPMGTSRRNGRELIVQADLPDTRTELPAPIWFV